MLEALFDELWLAVEGWLADAVLLEEVELLDAAVLLDDAAVLLEAASLALLLMEPGLALEGWFALVEVLLAIGLPETPRAARVCWSRPEPEMPCCCWKACSAFSVFGPMMPSIAPGSWPLSFNACWTWRTCGSAWADAWDDVPDWEPLVLEAWLALEADLFVAAWLVLLDAWLLEAIEAWLDEEPCACLSVE